MILRAATVVALVLAIFSFLLGSSIAVSTTAQEQLDISVNQNTTNTTNTASTGIIDGNIDRNKTIISKPASASDEENNTASVSTMLLNDTDSESPRLGPSDGILPTYPCDISNVWFLDEEHPNFFGEDEPISDCVYGSSITDYIDGDSGNDFLYGQDGNDVIYGASGNDRVEGNVGTDFLRGGSGNDTIYGGPGNDEMQDEGGQDIVFGGIGDDEFINGPDVDEFNCGAGIDVIWSLPTDAEDIVNDDCQYRTPIPKPDCPPGSVPLIPPSSTQLCTPIM